MHLVPSVRVFVDWPLPVLEIHLCVCDCGAYADTIADRLLILGEILGVYYLRKDIPHVGLSTRPLQ